MSDAQRCARVRVTRPSAFFTPGRDYDVLRWNEDDVPWVRNDRGSKTWLMDKRWWVPVDEPLTLARSQELIHARWRAIRAAVQDV